MKRVIFILVCVILAGVLTCCGQKDIGSAPKSRVSVTPKVTPPSDSLLAKYKNGRYVILEDLFCTYGEELWQEFYKSVTGNKPASVKIICYYTLNKEGVSSEYYEAEKDNYPVICLNEVDYDGKKFTITTRDIKKAEPEAVKEYQFLKRYIGKPSSPFAIFSYYEYYVLVNDNSVTWPDIEYGILSSRMGDYIDHYTVFEKIYK